MRIDLRNSQRHHLFCVDIDTKDRPPIVKPPHGESGNVYLNWDRTLDDENYLCRCPACECRELFVRKDFSQVTGFIIVAMGAVISVVVFGFGYVWQSLAVLGLIALVDAIIYLFSAQCLVCYRCRSEFRDLPIRKDQATWDLATGEKYRQSEQEHKVNNLANEDRRD